MINLKQIDFKLSIWGKSAAQDLHETLIKKMFSLEFLCNILHGKYRTNKNYQKSEILDEKVLLAWIITFFMTGS